eukprot:1155620-Pelagomonas_calceolata.AAC.15
MFDAWRAHSMQRAHSHAAMTPEGPSVSGAAAAAWDNTHFSGLWSCASVLSKRLPCKGWSTRLHARVHNS